MNWFIGMTRLGFILSVLYWICAVKIAVTRATLGVWPYGQDPLTFLVCAGMFYLIWYGFFWALTGFFIWPGRGRY